MVQSRGGFIETFYSLDVHSVHIPFDAPFYPVIATFAINIGTFGMQD